MASPGKSKRNLLDMIPEKKPRLKWQLTPEERVQLVVERRGFVERMVRVFAKTPRHLTVDLDEFGSFVWQAIDGQQDICQIGALVKEAFGDRAEPLYERLGGFMNLLRNNGFITCRFPEE